MAGISASRDRRGCKYGLWLGLGVFAARCLGGEYDRPVRRAVRRTRYALISPCVRGYPSAMCVCVCLRDAPDREDAGNASVGDRSDADYFAEKRDRAVVFFSLPRMWNSARSGCPPRSRSSVPFLPKRLPEPTIDAARRAREIDERGR